MYIYTCKRRERKKGEREGEGGRGRGREREKKGGRGREGGPQTQIGVGSHWGLFHEPRNLAMPTGKPLAC